jgi:hypothetical protein
LDLATIKGVRKFVADMQRAGFRINLEVVENEGDKRAFDDQLGGL